MSMVVLLKQVAEGQGRCLSVIRSLISSIPAKRRMLAISISVCCTSGSLRLYHYGIQ